MRPSTLDPHLATGCYFLGLMASIIYIAAVLTMLITAVREPDVLKSGLFRGSLGPTFGFVFLYATAEAVVGFLIGLFVVYRTNLTHKRAVYGLTLSSLVLIPTAITALLVLL